MTLTSTSCKQILCPAKINLHLSIGEKFYEQDQEYHRVLTLLQRVLLSEGDLLSLSLEGTSGTPKISVQASPEPCTEQENLVYKAAQLYLERSPRVRWPRSIHFDLKKGIPEQAGLAGGSSNAAAALQLLNEALPAYAGTKPLSLPQLYDLARALGTDIAFFLQDRSLTSWASGRGEQIHDVSPPCQDILQKILRSFSLYLVKPRGVSCPTKTMYQLLKPQAKDMDIAHFEREIEEIEDRCERQQDKIRGLSKLFCNDFFTCIQNYLVKEDIPDLSLKEDFQILASLHDYLYSLAASWVALSGSGAAFFAFFPPELNHSEIRKGLDAFPVPLEFYPARIS